MASPVRSAFGTCVVFLLLIAVSPAAAKTVYVANNGVDPPGCAPPTCISGSCQCGTKAAPCRSITCGIMTAAAGDTVLVGPGRYGDFDGDGTPGDTDGEESPGLNSPGCGCMVAINKSSLTIVSSNGAAETMIDAHTVHVNSPVLIIASNVRFGAPGKGFTVTQALGESGGIANGIVIDGATVEVRGDQVIRGDGLHAGVGILAIDDGPGPVLIADSEAFGWSEGFVGQGSGKTITRNHASQNVVGVVAEGTTDAIGNVTTGNHVGITVQNSGRALGNAIYGNDDGLNAVETTTTMSGNNIWGSSECGLYNNTGGGTLVATGNFWGAPTGPGSYPADRVCTQGNTTTVTPFATKPFKVKAHFKS